MKFFKLFENQMDIVPNKLDIDKYNEYVEYITPIVLFTYFDTYGNKNDTIPNNDYLKIYEIYIEDGIYIFSTMDKSISQNTASLYDIHLTKADLEAGLIKYTANKYNI